MKLEIAFPAHAEAKVLPIFLTELSKVIAVLPKNTAIVCTLFDDSSNDATPDIYARWCGQFSERFDSRYFRAAKRVGYAAAIAHLIAFARSDTDALVLLDSDLQDPPALIENLMTTWQKEPNTAVIARRISRRGKFWENLSSSLFHTLMRLVRSYSADSGIFGIYPQTVLEELQKESRQMFFLPELLSQLKISIDYIDISRAPRAIGNSKSGWLGRFHLAYIAIGQMIKHAWKNRIWPKRYWVIIPAVVIAILFGLLVILTKNSLLEPAAYIRY